MRLIIAGSRDLYVSMDELFEILEKFDLLYKVKEIVSGGAKGIDTCGEVFAKWYKIPAKVFLADWNKYGALAGPRRNREMARYSDALLVIHNRSKGSLHMKKCMETMKKPVFEVLK